MWRSCHSRNDLHFWKCRESDGRARCKATAVFAFVLLGFGPTLATELQPHLTAELLDARGATEIAQGQLIQEIDVVRLPLQGAGPGCGKPHVKYGSFRRLKLDKAEFVCVSFHKWECYESK